MSEDLKASLLNLQGLEFIYEKQLFPELEYIFKHALTQEVAYNSLLLKRRKEIHEKIGQAIEELYSERLEEYYELLAYHYVRSDNKLKAVEYLSLANRKAAKVQCDGRRRRLFRTGHGASGCTARIPLKTENAEFLFWRTRVRCSCSFSKWRQYRELLIRYESLRRRDGKSEAPWGLYCMHGRV